MIIVVQPRPAAEDGSSNDEDLVRVVGRSVRKRICGCECDICCYRIICFLSLLACTGMILLVCMLIGSFYTELGVFRSDNHMETIAVGTGLGLATLVVAVGIVMCLSVCIGKCQDR